MSTNQVFRRAVFTVAAVGATGLLTSGIASAHVTANVYGDEPQKGGYGAIVLRVPNEEQDAATTRVELTVKPEYAVSSLRTKPVPGWTAEVVKTTLPAPVKNAKGADVTEAVTKVTWTAQPGSEIKAGTTEYQEFEISAGPLPGNVDEILLPAAQTYSSGKVVNWDQPTPEGGEEPDKPAPTVKLAEAAGDGHGHGHEQEPESASGESHGDDAAAGTDDTARWLGGAGLAVGALGIGIGTGATLRARKAGAGK